MSITSHVLEDIHYVVLPPVISESSVNAVQGSIDEWAKHEVSMHVFDFKATSQISDSFIKVMSNFSNKIKASMARLVSLNMSDALFARIQSAGAEKVFNRVQNLEEDLLVYKKRPGAAETRVLLFKYLAEGALATVAVALSSAVNCSEKVSVTAEEAALDKFDVMSVIDVNTNFIRADFRLLFTFDVLNKLCCAMHGQQAKVEPELLESMALEMLNMIYGHAKSNLNEMEGFRMPPAIPKLVRKNAFQNVKRSLASDLKIIPVVTPHGSFYVEVDFIATKA